MLKKHTLPTLAVSSLLALLPISSHALSKEYEKCVNAENHAPLDMCASMELDRQSEKMESVYKNALKSNPELSKSQAKWLKQLDKDCPDIGGTTFAHETWSQCQAEKTEERIAELQTKTFAKGSDDRKAIMDALRIPVQQRLGVPVQFVVQTLNVVGDYAFMMGVPQQKNGQPIDYSKTIYGSSDAFEDAVTALFKRDGKRWNILIYNMGATDLVQGCWWREYNVPKVLFGNGVVDDCNP